MATPNLKPVEGKVILKFLDEETDEEHQRRIGPHSPGNLSQPKGVFAQVVAVGAKVPVKVGDIALVYPWARDGLDVGDG